MGLFCFFLYLKGVIQMSKTSLSQFTKGISTSIAKHSPEILTGIGIAGMVTSTVIAVRATPKALALISEEEISLGIAYGEKLPIKETIQATWKCYIPSAITGVLSISCLVGASKVNLKRNAVLATAYKLSETALTEYRDAVIETIGEKKEHQVKDKVAENRMKSDPVSKKEVFVTGKGSTRCYDYHNGRYFYSDMETIRRAQNNLNNEMLKNDYVSLNDFYDELGLDHTEQGDELGWRVVDGMIEIDFNSCLADDGTPCLVMSYSIAPKRDYYKFG